MKSKSTTTQAPASGRGRELAELRSGNRAGLHVKRRRDRANVRRQAIRFASI